MFAIIIYVATILEKHSFNIHYLIEKSIKVMYIWNRNMFYCHRTNNANGRKVTNHTPLCGRIIEPLCM